MRFANTPWLPATSRSNDIDIDDRAAAGVSFPGFWELLDRLTAAPPAA